MKKILTTITLAALIIIVGCTDLDDIYRQLDEQKKELATVKELINAINKKISVVSYKELDDKSGYELTMSDGSKIILKHGAKGDRGEQGEQGERGERGERGEQGAPGQDGDANLTITETAEAIIIVYKGVTYTLPKGEAPVTMTLTTAKNVGEKITLFINAAAADQPDIWIDLNNNGNKDEGEAVTVFGSNVDYLLGAQTVTVYGKVTVLGCGENLLTSLDVSNNTALTYLSCDQNRLTSLDVSHNTALVRLLCNHNQLTSLDVRHNTALVQLTCYTNQLTLLNVSKNTALTSLWCRSNQLTLLDVSKNIALRTLSCGQNRLTSLDVSNNTALTELWCDWNQLTSLDVSNNTALTKLFCSSNQLTVLDVSNNTALTLLWCYINKISGDNMTALVNSLPTRTAGNEGSFQVISLTNSNEQNKCTTTQVGIATDKNWKVLNSGANPYPGSD